jgi:hypothetical protein
MASQKSAVVLERFAFAVMNAVAGFGTLAGCVMTFVASYVDPGTPSLWSQIPAILMSL